MRRLMLVASLVLVAAGACSSGGDAEPPPTTVAAGLRGKLLVAADLPDAFSRVRIEERDPTTTNSEYCAELDAHNRDFPGERVAEAQFRRVKGTATIFVNEIITRYPNTEQGDRAFVDFEKALDQCASVTKRDAGNSINGTFTPVEFPQLGDDSYATTFSATQTVDEDSASISGHFIAFRARNYVVLLSALGSTDTLAKKDVEDIAKKAVSRI